MKAMTNYACFYKLKEKNRFKMLISTNRFRQDQIGFLLNAIFGILLLQNED